MLGKNFTAGKLLEAQRMLNEANEAYAAAKQDIATAQQDVTTAQQEYTIAQQKLNTAQQELNTVQEKLTRVQQEFNVAQQEFNAVEQNFTTAKQKLNNAHHKLTIEQCDICLKDAVFQAIAAGVENFGTKFPVAPGSITEPVIEELKNRNRDLELTHDSETNQFTVKILTEK